MESDNFTTWRKATYSHANGSCVEVASNGLGLGIRDTLQHGAGPVLQFSAAAWETFIGATRPEHASHLS
jgi:predicted secreted Zn-dependent protease